MSNINLYYDNRNNRVFIRNNQPQQRQQPHPPTQQQHTQETNDLDGNQLLEISVKDFFEKFQPPHANSNIIEGPRGFPGLIGPQGPPGKGLDDELVKSLKTIVSEYKKPKHLQKDKIHSLLYGLKKTNVCESNYNGVSSSSYFKIMKNNEYDNDIIYDSFYLPPNILEINEYSHYNYVHDRKIEKFTNIHDTNDNHYFPMEYTPSGFPVHVHSQAQNLVIQNITWNIVQFLNDSKYEDFHLLGTLLSKNTIKTKKIKLNLHFELHTQIPYHLIKNRTNIMPYIDDNINILNPSQTCVTHIQTIQIETLNGSYEDNIRINLDDLVRIKDIKNVLLCVRISVDKKTIHHLKGLDINDKQNFGYIPFTQFLLNFDYYIE